MTAKETKSSLKEDLAKCEKASDKWEKKYDKANVAAHAKKPDLAVGTFEMALSQSGSDGSAIYRVTKSDNTLFSIGTVTAMPGFLPRDPDFNVSFINAESNDPATQSKQKEFAKFLKLKVKIEM
jgi:hypothetical protein